MGSHRHSPWHRAAPRARSLLASPGSRTSPAPTPGNGAATRTHRGRITGRAGSPVPQNPHRCGTRGAPRETSAGANLPCAAAERGAVRCGTGAGRVRALRQHRPLRARVQRLRVAPPTTHKPRPSLDKPRPPPQSAPPPALCSARGPRSEPRGCGLRAARPPNPGAPPVPGAARSPPCSPEGPRGAERSGSPWERGLAAYLYRPDDVTVVSAAAPQWCCCSCGVMVYLYVGAAVPRQGGDSAVWGATQPIPGSAVPYRCCCTCTELYCSIHTSHAAAPRGCHCTNRG